MIARLLPLASPLLDPNTRAQAEANVAAVEAEVRQAQATVARARQASRLAARNRQRVEILRRGGAAAAAEVDQVEAEAKTAADAERVADAGVRVAEARLNAARAALGNGAETAGAVEVVAPVSGRVLRLGPQLEGAIAAGTALMEIGSLEAHGGLRGPAHPRRDPRRPGRSAVPGALGRSAAAEGHGDPGGAGRVHPGLGAGGGGAADLGRGAPGHPARGSGRGWEMPSGWRCTCPSGAAPTPSRCRKGPSSAASGGWEVLVADGCRLAGRQVRIGERNGTVAEVLEGLEAGEQVVVHPGERARAGVRYRVLEAR